MVLARVNQVGLWTVIVRGGVVQGLTTPNVSADVLAFVLESSGGLVKLKEATALVSFVY